MWFQLLLVLHQTQCAKILGVVPTPSYSHQVAFHPLWKELSLRGHHVTVFTTNPINDTSLNNLREIDWSSSYTIYDRVFPDIINNWNILKGFYNGAHMVEEMVDGDLAHPDVKKIISDEQITFDLVMIELFYPAMFAFSRRFNCSFIGLSSIDAPFDSHEIVGNPIHPIFYPNYLLSFMRPTNFFQRVYSVASYVFFKGINILLIHPIHDGVVRKHFGEDFPSVKQLHNNLDMMFVNTNPIFHNVRPVMPNVINFGGGRSLNPIKSLDKDLQEYLDKATEGFIYFNLGTNVKSQHLSNYTKNIIKHTFSRLPYKILWKYELHQMEDKPSNVRIMRWLPQQDVLRHRNIKLFITQGGIQSIEEAVKCHVPMVIIPFFGDQFANAQKVHSMGYGIYIDAHRISKKNFRKAIQEVINNSTYRERIEQIAEIVDDQPVNGIEKLVWWTEYVLRHKNVDHLKTRTDIPLYQFYYVDIAAFCIFLVYMFFYIIKKCINVIVYKFQFVKQKEQ